MYDAHRPPTSQIIAYIHNWASNMFLRQSQMMRWSIGRDLDSLLVLMLNCVCLFLSLRNESLYLHWKANVVNIIMLNRLQQNIVTVLLIRTTSERRFSYDLSNETLWDTNIHHSFRMPGALPRMWMNKIKKKTKQEMLQKVT